MGEDEVEDEDEDDEDADDEDEDEEDEDESDDEEYEDEFDDEEYEDEFDDEENEDESDDEEYEDEYDDEDNEAHMCPSDYVMFKVDLLPDMNNEFIFFNLKRFEDKEKLLNGYALEPSTLQSHETCIYKFEIHQFTITDLDRDGLCCDNGEGYYELFCNGNSIHFSTFDTNGKDRMKERVKFTPAAIC